MRAQDEESMTAHTQQGHMHGAAGLQGSEDGYGDILQEEVEELEKLAKDGGNIMALETWTPAEEGIVHLTVYRGW